jgi:hypothetical protein
MMWSILAGRRRSEMVFFIRAFIYESLPLEHDRGAGRSEPSEWEGSFTPKGPGAGPILV